MVIEETGEVELYCHLELRKKTENYSCIFCKKEQAMQDSFAEKYALVLDSLHKGLSKKGSPKKVAKVLERMGRLN